MLRGEPSFFSGGSELTTADYLGLFDHTKTSFKPPDGAHPKDLSPGAQRYGEKSPSYFSMPDEAIGRCASLLPEVRLICTVREPVERAWSHVKWMKEMQRVRVLWAARTGAPSDLLDEVIRQGRYGEHLVRWARHFPPEQILLIDFARLAAEPDAVYAEALRFLGLPPLPAAVEMHCISASGTHEPMPPELRQRLSAAYAGEDWTVAGLREAMQAARAAHPGEALTAA